MSTDLTAFALGLINVPLALAIYLVQIRFLPPAGHILRHRSTAQLVLMHVEICAYYHRSPLEIPAILHSTEFRRRFKLYTKNSIIVMS